MKIVDLDFAEYFVPALYPSTFTITLSFRKVKRMNKIKNILNL